MHKELKVGEICEIIFGLPSKPSLTGTFKRLSPANFDTNNKPSKFDNRYIEPNQKLSKRCILQRNDVLTPSVGPNPFAWAYKEEFGKCVPNQAFYVLRPKLENFIFGEYLAYFLNTSRIQSELKTIPKGGNIRIPTKGIKELIVHVPTLDIQKQIIEQGLVFENQILNYQKKLAKAKAQKDLELMKLMQILT